MNECDERGILMAYFAIIASIFTGEFFIKELVEHYVKPGEKKLILKEKLFLTKYHNYGAALNFMEKKQGMVAILSVILSIICTIFFLITFTRGGKEPLKLSLAFLLGGAYSNTYDRLKRKYVVDYVGFQHKKKRKKEIIYNLSDFCIILGAMFSALFGIK